MAWLTGNAAQVWQVAAKAALIYATAVVILRLAERRTLAQWTIMDFATAVAFGAIIGRTALAGGQSYLTGAVALATLVAAHRLASRLRFHPVLGHLLDHRVRVLVVDGTVRHGELRRCGLTEGDLYAHLREHGVFSTASLRFVLYETQGTITVVPADRAGADGDLLQAALDDAAGYP